MDTPQFSFFYDTIEAHVIIEKFLENLSKFTVHVDFINKRK